MAALSFRAAPPPGLLRSGIDVKSTAPSASNGLRMRKRLTHVEADGSVRMVDVGAKPSTARAATAEALVRMSSGALRALKSGVLKKGDALAVARIAGIQAAKRTAELVPLAHPLPIAHVEVACTFRGATSMHVSCTVRVNAQTGVEMEALVGAAIAALAIYDMCKALDRGITIEYLRLLEKRGGKSGVYRRDGRHKVDRSK